jgi:hypothetical protein
LLISINNIAKGDKMVKHIIDIPKETNDKIKMCRIKHSDLKNVSDVIAFVFDGYLGE